MSDEEMERIFQMSEEELAWELRAEGLDPDEVATVRKNFLKGKLGLTQDDATLDAAIADVAKMMKADRTKSRATVYYLLADKFDKLGVFK